MHLGDTCAETLISLSFQGGCMGPGQQKPQAGREAATSAYPRGHFDGMLFPARHKALLCMGLALSQSPIFALHFLFPHRHLHFSEEMLILSVTGQASFSR